MFHNVLMTNLTPLRDTNEINCWDNRPFTTIWPEVKQMKSKETTLNKTIKKKTKRNRTMFTTEQIRLLENVFVRSKYIDIERRRELAECLKMDQKCIKVWFQNRRMKEKRTLSECCESARESVAESMSPPLETSQPNQVHSTYLHPSVDNYARPDYYYCASNSYMHADVQQNNETYETPIISTTSPVYADLDTLKNENYLGQYFQPEANMNCFYNTGYVNNQYVKTHFNYVNWA